MRLCVVHEQAVLEVLAGVGEVEAEHFDVAAGAGEARGRRDADQVAAEGDGDVLEVASRPTRRLLRARRGRRRRPIPAPMTTVRRRRPDVDLDVLGDGARTPWSSTTTALENFSATIDHVLGGRLRVLVPVNRRR